MANRVLLYVEDEDAAVFLLDMAIKEAQIQLEVHRVADGEEALAYLAHAAGYAEEPDPDLILLDLNLPKKNGLEVLAEMQHAEGLRRIPVVVFTSSALASDKKRSMALGARQFITKPPSFEGLVAAVKSAYSQLSESPGTSV